MLSTNFIIIPIALFAFYLPTVCPFSRPLPLNHYRTSRPRLNSRPFPLNHYRRTLRPRLNSILTDYEESLGPILPIITTLTSIPLFYIAYNLEEWKIRGNQLPPSRIAIKDVEGKGKGAFLRGGDVKKKAVVGIYGGEVSTQTQSEVDHHSDNTIAYTYDFLFPRRRCLT